jgi:transposase
LLKFLQKTVLPEFGGGHKIYVIWDNYSSDKKAVRLWTAKPAEIEFTWTPTNSSWLNLIEPWFLVLQRTALYNTDLKTTDAIAEHLVDAIAYLNKHPRPYRWTKAI